MNPITHFEGLARGIWASSASDSVKAKRLEEVGTALDRYIERLEVELKNVDDPWNAAAMGRASIYLSTLSSDIRKLSQSCSKVHVA